MTSLASLRRVGLGFVGLGVLALATVTPLLAQARPTDPAEVIKAQVQPPLAADGETLLPWKEQLSLAAMRLPLAAVLGGILALRPRRRGS